MAFPQLSAPVRCRTERVPHGGVLFHRRHRPEGRRGPAALAGLPRFVDRAGQPLPVQRRARAGAPGVHATGHQPGRPVHRPRPVQVGQRLVRPRQRGRGPPGPGPAVQVGGPGRRRREPLLRRRVRRLVPQRPRRRRGHQPGHRVLTPPVRSRPAVHRSQRGGHLQRGHRLRHAGAPVGSGHPAAGRRGHVPGQEQGPVTGRGVRRVAPGEVGGPPGDLRRSPPLHRPRRAGGALPAHRLGQGRPHRGHGGAGPLAPPVPGTARTDGIHPLRRGDRPHLLAGAVGPP